ncbi:hypothetical protein AGMMS49936_10410 [Endomicrobiia bacterium]|nr:hypothetical protein AGMMS49936_10410 [Endomicrobiia bacterium]
MIDGEKFDEVEAGVDVIAEARKEDFDEVVAGIDVIIEARGEEFDEIKTSSNVVVELIIESVENGDNLMAGFMFEGKDKVDGVKVGIEVVRVVKAVEDADNLKIVVDRIVITLEDINELMAGVEVFGVI